MKSTAPLVMLLVLLPFLATQAAQPNAVAVELSKEDAAPAVVIDAAEVTIPERKIQFEHSEEAYKLKLFRADPKLLEQKYVAAVRFRRPEDYRYLGNVVIRFPEELKVLTTYEHHDLLFPTLRSGDQPLLHSQYFRHLVANLPEDKMPAAEALAFFTGDRVNTDLQQFTSGHIGRIGGGFGSPDRLEFAFQILAPTAEVAQQRAETLVHLFDYGLTLPIQKHLFVLKREEEARVLELEETAAKAQESHAALSETLKDTTAIPREELTALTAQQRLLSIDLGGTNARIAAASKMLADRRNPSRIEQIENIKIAAEIELAGLTERQKLLDAIIGQAQQRLQLEGRIRSASSEHEGAQTQKAKLAKSIGSYEQAMELLKPFPLVDDKIVIQPLEWTE